MFPIKNDFELWVRKSNKNLYSVRCILSTCKWVIRATIIEGCDIFKISKCTLERTCNIEASNHNH